MSDHETPSQETSPSAREDIQYETIENPSLDLIRAVGQGLDEYNRAHVGDYTYCRLAIVAFAPSDSEPRTMIGGVYGDLLWDWLYIQTLWVRPEYRRDGVGTALMRRAEEAARARGIANIHLETTSFQALQFYRKLGFEVFGELPNKPIGQTWYYLKKQGTSI